MAIIHDVSVTMKVVITQTELLDQDNTSRPPKKNSGQSKYVLEHNNDLPALRITSAELKTRISNMMACLYYGFQVNPLDSPPVVETVPASSITAISAVLNGNVTGAGCTAGFQIGTDRNLSTGTVVGVGSPTGVLATIKAITYPWVGLTTKTKYYYRFFAQYTATGNTQYGLIKSFTTL
jgi:hypothetical protein